MIIFGWGEKKITPRHQDTYLCPDCNNKQVSLHHFVKYFDLFWIPTFPFKKRMVAHCSNCDVAYEGKYIPDTVRGQSIAERSSAKIPWWSFSGLGIIGMLVVAFMLIPRKEKYYYPNGKLQSEGKEIGGKMDGLWTFYDEDGYLRSKNHLAKGSLHGKSLWYYQNGELEAEEYYKNDLLDGSIHNYYENGQLSDMGQYKEGRETGVWESYHENGKLYSKGKYERGYMDSLWTYWYENENRRSEGTYDLGSEIGMWTYWFENGQKNVERNYSEDHSELINAWNKHGEKTVANGNGFYVTHHENGLTESEGRVKDGVLHGTWTD